MGDFAGFATLGVVGTQSRPLTEQALPLLKPVEQSAKGQGLSSGTGSNTTGSRHSRHETPEALVVPMPKPKPQIDSATIPGPPPAFQVSILELDAQLLEALAKMNAAHGMAKDSQAIAPKMPEKTAHTTAQTPVETGALEQQDKEEHASAANGEAKPRNGADTAIAGHAPDEDAPRAQPTEQPAAAQAETPSPVQRVDFGTSPEVGRQLPAGITGE